jgi:hypothetical protein
MRQVQPLKHKAQRQAALAVHALAEADRAWLLAQLPAAERGQLVCLLEELRELGIPPQPDLLDEALRHAKPAPTSHTAALAMPGTMATDIRKQQTAELCRLDGPTAALLLQHEPPGLIAQLLEVHPWPWREALLDSLNPIKLHRVEATLDGLRRRVQTKAPEALHHALIAGLHRRATEATVLSGHNSAASPAGHSGGPMSRRGLRWGAFLARKLRFSRARSA